jgi:hypothetical protein
VAAAVLTNAPGRIARVDEALPRLLDCKRLREELGISRAAAEAIMRQLPVIEPPGLRKVYVRRNDVARFLEENLRFK